MTNEEYLKMCGLSDEDIEAMREMGYRINIFDDVASLNELTFKYLDVGLGDKAEELQDLRNGAIAYIQDYAMQKFGADIQFLDTLYGGVGGWYNNDTHQIIGKLHIDYTVDQDEYDKLFAGKLGIE